jgi:hypothetical protein
MDGWKEHICTAGFFFWGLIFHIWLLFFNFEVVLVCCSFALVLGGVSGEFLERGYDISDDHDGKIIVWIWIWT